MALPPTPPKNLSIGITITADDLKPSTRTYRDPLDATIESKIARRIVSIGEDGQSTTEAHRTTTTITIVEEHYTTRPTEMIDYYYATTQEDLP